MSSLRRLRRRALLWQRYETRAYGPCGLAIHRGARDVLKRLDAEQGRRAGVWTREDLDAIRARARQRANEFQRYVDDEPTAWPCPCGFRRWDHPDLEPGEQVCTCDGWDDEDEPGGEWLGHRPVETVDTRGLT